MSAVVKPIETNYKGFRFRSRLEARWAVFFDEMDVLWTYEPQGYSFEDGTFYLPDFYLPDLKTFVEVKGDMSTEDEHKLRCFETVIKGLTDDSKWPEIEKPVPRLMVLGEIPPEGPISLWINKRYFGDGVFGPKAYACYDVFMGWDFPYLPCVCPECGKFGFQFEGMGDRICNHNNKDHDGWTENHPRILSAYRRARRARFEHGENP